MRKWLLLGVCFSAITLIAACGGGDDDNTPSGSSSSSSASGTGATATATGTTAATSGTASTVQATLAEFSITVDKAAVPSGKVTFNANNKGAIAHELVVIKSDLAPDKLPVVAAGTVDEANVNKVGEIAQFDAGKTESDTLTLTPGKYVLICDVPGHYQAGMHIAFTVQ